MRLKRRLRILHWKKSETDGRHICDLTKGSDSHLPRLPPNANFSLRFKRRVQKIFLVSANHPLTKRYLRSKAAIAFEKRKHGISPNWWVIHPCSNFRFFWEVIMALTLIYMFVMIPHTTAFFRMSKKESERTRNLALLTPGYIICLIDIVLNFVTGFISPDGHEILIDPLFIMKHYVGSFFFIDLLSSVPYTWFYEEQLQEPKKDVKLHLLFLETLPFLKFFRISSLRHYIRAICVVSGASRILENGIWIIILTTLIFHWSACFCYVIPFYHAYITRKSLAEAEGFLFNTALYKKPNWFRYLTSLHMGGGNLCSYSFIEFRHTDLPDKITRCILLLLGMSYFLYVTVIVLQLVSSSAEPELKYQAIMYGVRDYINNKKLPRELKERLLHFYEHRFQGSLFKEKAITSTLSKHLKQEITQNSSKILIESTALFSNMPRSLVNSIVGVLKLVIFLQGDVIYKSETEGKCMYFIVTGTVAIISYSGVEVCHLRDGDFFGEIALVQHNHRRVASVVALEVCEVLRLDRRDFNRLIPPKSEFYARLESVAQRRLNETEELERQFSESTGKNESTPNSFGGSQV